MPGPNFHWTDKTKINMYQNNRKKKRVRERVKLLERYFITT